MKSIEALQSDRKALEKVARQKGYAKRDEIIQQLPQSPEAAKYTIRIPDAGITNDTDPNCIVRAD